MLHAVVGATRRNPDFAFQIHGKLLAADRHAPPQFVEKVQKEGDMDIPFSSTAAFRLRNTAKRLPSGARS
jgi:hypothetical protein